MIAEVLFAALTLAFPKEGQRMPPVSRVYLIGATDGGETNLVICGKSVTVYRTGAWATMMDVVPGENAVEWPGGRRTFIVERAPQPVAAAEAAKKPARVYTKLEWAADAPKPHPAGRPPAGITVAVDAGHGGEDAGAISPHGWAEKDANLLLAQEVARELSARGFKVVMTRTNDVAVALYDRPRIAHAAGADAFISIHHNAPPCDRDPRVLRYHAVYAWNAIGEVLAKAVNARMAAALDPAAGGPADNGVLHANFAVTRNPEVPSCLVEADFITSPEGEEAIWTPSCRRRTAAAIAAGFADWSSRNENAD